MAMNNSNYGYPSSGYSSPYSSTPSGMRTQRPRFGYSGPSLYPRPRSSASKPNPDSFSDSMINNYGNSNSLLDVSYNSENENSSYDSYQQSSGSNYYSANDTFYRSPINEEPSYLRSDTNLMRSDTTSLRNDTGSLLRNSPLMYDDTNTMHGYSSLRSQGDNQNSGILPKPTSQFGTSNYSYNNSSYGTLNNVGEFKGKFQKPLSSFGFGDKSSKPAFNRKFGKAKRRMTAPNTNTKPSPWKCELCGLDFTSQIPYDMHLGGARHAKKLKAKEALTNVQSQGTKTAAQKAEGDKGFFCELCNVKANSLLQLQTHLDGSKHKNKLQPKEPKTETDESSKEKVSNTSVNGKSNGSLTRPLPSEFGEPQPAKLTKYACDTCGISVNSEAQLQQHLSSKKHQNKVEGKPVVKGKKNKVINKADLPAENTEIKMDTTEKESTETTNNESSKMVVGVKTLASSFVQGETLQ